MLPAFKLRIDSRAWRTAFSLVELMVTIVIISILASLTLAGLSGVRRRGLVEKTRSTIRKIDDFVQSQYQSYCERRVAGIVSAATAPTAGTHSAYDVFLNTAASPMAFYGPRTNAGSWPGPYTDATTKKPSTVVAQGLLAKRRLLMAFEMPDSWADVRNSVSIVASGTTGTPALPTYCQTGAVRGYAAVKSALRSSSSNVNPTAEYEGAECLYLIAARSGLDPYAIEQFRSDEIGDKDGDGAPEFHDSWGNPILFLRSAPGFTPYSAIQINDPMNRHDPMDPQRVDSAGYALTPLIVSGGNDGSIGLQRPDDAWSSLDLSSIVLSGSAMGIVNPDKPNDYRDNVTNHALSR